MVSKAPESTVQPEFAPDEEINKLFAIANESTEPVLAQPDSMTEHLKARAAVVGSFLAAELSEGLGDSKEVRAALDMNPDLTASNMTSSTIEPSAA